MADLALRPRSATEIVDAAFQLYRRNAAPMILVTAIAYVPSLVLGLFLVTAGTTLQGAMTSAVAADFGLVVVGWLITLVTFTMMSGVLTRVGSEMLLGREPDLAEAIRTTVGRVPALVGATILKMLLTGLAMIPVMLVLIFVTAALAGAFAAIFGPRLGPVVAGLIALAMFAAMGATMLYMLARLFATTPLVVLERRGPMEAITRSGTLSAGRKRHIAAALALVFVIYLLLFGATMVVSLLAKSSVVQLLVLQLFYVLAYPIFAMTEVLLYYDARIRAEAFDIEVLAGALDPQPSGAAAR